MKDTGADVYAVWAMDRNGNGMADYEEACSLTYNGNAQEDGTVSNEPVDGNSYIPGDKVTLELSPYDLTKGRIIWRDK